MQCVVCRQYLPSNFAKKIEGTKHWKCDFCIQGKDRIYRLNNITNDLVWDVKEVIVKQYKDYLDDIARNQDKRKELYKNIKK